MKEHYFVTVLCTKLIASSKVCFINWEALKAQNHCEGYVNENY